MHITLIGRGRVGTHMSGALAEAGHVVTWLHGRALPDALPSPCDAVVISVPDSVLPSVARRLADIAGDTLLLHTSGSIGLEVFGDGVRHCGVLYPMQTFSMGREVDMREVPFFVEATDDESRRTVEALARTLSGSVTCFDSAQRRRLHVAAVFACNFVNHCMTMADEQLRPLGLDYHTMLPLLTETVGKLHLLSPQSAQTGPAARGDRSVVEAHAAMIDDPLSRDIYRLMSESIAARHRAASHEQ